MGIPWSDVTYSVGKVFTNTDSFIYDIRTYIRTYA